MFIKLTACSQIIHEHNKRIHYSCKIFAVKIKLALIPHVLRCMLGRFICGISLVLLEILELKLLWREKALWTEFTAVVNALIS